MKKLIAAVVILAALAGGGYYAWKKTKATGKTGYETEKVSRGDITAAVSATGKLAPKTQVLVGTEVSGTIRNIYVDYNSPVKKGQVLLRLDQSLFKTQVDRTEADLRAAQGRLDELKAGVGMQRSDVRTLIERTKASLKRASDDYDRKKTLYDRGMIAKQELDTAMDAFVTAKTTAAQAEVSVARDDVTDAQVAQAKAAVAQSRANLDNAKTNLSKTVITAPMDGVVIDKTVEVGQTVAASFNTPTLLTIGDLSLMEVDASIDEADVGMAKVGQQVEFTVDAFPRRTFKGTLSKIYYAPVITSNVVSYTGVIYAENPDEALRPGMTANVRVITSVKEGALLIPNAALRVKVDAPHERPKDAAKGARLVWVMKEGAKAPVPAYVVLGITDSTRTEVVSGLKEGDEVVTESPLKAAGGSGGGRSSGGGGGPGGGGVMRMGR